MPDTVEINYDNASGPLSAGTIETATAICDEGWWAIGGGARTTPSNNPSSLKPIGSFPSNTSGTPAADESTNTRAWTAVGLIGTPGQNSSLTEAYTICTNDTDFAVTPANGRPRRPRRQSNDRHPAPPPAVHPRPADPPRRSAHPAPAPGHHLLTAVLTRLCELPHTP